MKDETEKKYEHKKEKKTNKHTRVNLETCNL
jgi:hypothetical protein